MFSGLYPMKNGSVDLGAIAADVGACKHFCPSKWAKVGGMLQMNGHTKFTDATNQKANF